MQSQRTDGEGVETRDDDQIKVSDRARDDFLSPNESSPLKDQIIPEDENNPDSLQKSRDGKMNQPDASITLDEAGTVKNPLTIDSLTIKRDLINPLSYSILDRSIKLLNIIEQIVPERENRERIIKTLLTILNSLHGPPVLRHLREFGAYTYREIELKLRVPKATIHYITNRLQFLQLVGPKDVVFPFDPSTPGPRPIVWGMVGADPKASVECIYRHYGLLKRDKIDVVEYQHEDKIEEILAFYRERYGKAAKNIERAHIRAYVTDFYPVKDSLEKKQIIERVYYSLQLEEDSP